MNIGFYTGYVNLTIGGLNPKIWELANDSDPKYENAACYGSELSLIKLGQALINEYNCKITIFSAYTPDIDTSQFDAVVVSRYINYFIYNIAKCPTILWLHDTQIIDWVLNARMFRAGSNLVSNLPRLDHIVTLTNWHKRHIQSQLNKFPDEKMSIIGHGLTPTKPIKIKKKPNSLMWTSDWERGLHMTIKILNLIDAKHKIEFNIYGEGSSKTRQISHWDGMQKDIDKSPHQINIHPYVDNKTIQEKWAETDIWFYPTHYPETYCITALEAQKAGCFCLTTNIAALQDIVANRGIVCHVDPDNDKFMPTMAWQLEHYLQNPNQTIPYRKRAKEWALKQTINHTAAQWYTLLKDTIATPTT
jgi:glycosyltransferase involved in cell wall biosynthesis